MQSTIPSNVSLSREQSRAKRRTKLFCSKSDFWCASKGRWKTPLSANSPEIGTQVGKKGWQEKKMSPVVRLCGTVKRK